MNTNNPLFTLSISEFSDLIRKIINEELLKSQEPQFIKYEDEHFNIDGLQKFLHCSKASIHNYKKEGLPFYRIGRKVLFQKSEVLAFLKSRQKKVRRYNNVI